MKFVPTSKYKLIRSFFSHLITEEIFEEKTVLEVMKRTYYCLLRSIKESISIKQLVKKYKKRSLKDSIVIQQYEDLSELEKKLLQNIQAFAKKKDKVE